MVVHIALKIESYMHAFPLQIYAATTLANVCFTCTVMNH